jgi:hypothetical protein
MKKLLFLIVIATVVMTSCNKQHESGLYEFTVITHEGLTLKDSFEMAFLPKESLCRTVHHAPGSNPYMTNPVEVAEVPDWYYILQKCSTEKTEYQFRTKVEYYFATPRLLKKR